MVLERDQQTGLWVAEIPGIAGCYSQGVTRDEALSNVREALQLIIETDGMPTLPQVEFAKIRVEA